MVTKYEEARQLMSGLKARGGKELEAAVKNGQAKRYALGSGRGALTTYVNQKGLEFSQNSSGALKLVTEEKLANDHVMVYTIAYVTAPEQLPTVEVTEMPPGTTRAVSVEHYKEVAVKMARLLMTAPRTT